MLHDCPCCGAPSYAVGGDKEGTCAPCSPIAGIDRCDPEETWHCDGRNGHMCDGTACETYGDPE